MAEKRLNTRIVHKHAVEADWLKATNFIPMAGELIVYDVDSQHSYERIKIGDGSTKVNALPFVDDTLRATLVQQIGTVDDKVDAVSTLVGDTAVSTQISNAVSKKADSVHTHDDRYYTESEINTKLNAKANADHTHEISELTDLSGASVNHATTAGTANAVAWTNVTGKPDTYTPATHNHKISDVTNLQTTLDAKVPTTRTVNGKALSANITLSAGDVGADASGAANTALTNAKSYTDAEITEWVGDKTVAAQISSAVASKADATHTHDDKYYTEAEVDNKLSGKSDTSHTHSAYVNQNAFSNVKVGDVTVAADSATDTITLVAGSNVTITPDATNDKITIASKDTVYTHPNSGVTAGTYKSVTVNSQGHVTGGSNPTTLSGYGITDAAAKSHSHNAATSSEAGFMSAADKVSLDEVVELVGDTSVADQIAEAIVSKSDVGHTHTAAQVGADPSGSAASALSSAKSYTDTKISNLINSAPTTLDTLGEIATAMDENADVVAALETAVGTKANASDLTAHTGNKSNPHGVTLSQLGITATAAELNYVDGVTSSVQTQLNAKVPTSRTVNGKALSANITLSASDVGADASGAANTALTNAKSYTDTQIDAMVGDDTVAHQISAAIEDVTLASFGVTATAAELNKLDGVTATTAELNYVDGVTSNIQTQLNGKAESGHTHSSYVNQNAFSNVTVGSTTITADTTTDTLTLVAGSNVTLTPDANNDKITIAATDTVYTHPNSGVTAGTYKSVTVNAQGHVTGGSNPTTLSGYGITDAATKTELNAISSLVGDTAVSEQISNAQIVYVGPTAPTDPNIQVWINTSEEGTGIIPVLPRIATITLTKAGWAGSAEPYSQVVDIATVTSSSKIDLQPTAQQIVSLQSSETSLMIENNGGAVTCYAIGTKPTVDYNMQVLIQEVAYV